MRQEEPIPVALGMMKSMPRSQPDVIPDSRASNSHRGPKPSIFCPPPPHPTVNSYRSCALPGSKSTSRVDGSSMTPLITTRISNPGTCRLSIHFYHPISLLCVTCSSSNVLTSLSLLSFANVVMPYLVHPTINHNGQLLGGRGP